MTLPRATWRRTRGVLTAAVALLFLAGPPVPASAAPVLTITPLTWNVLGLDSNSPATGPDLFPVGARVCNAGDAPATGASAELVWDSANAHLSVDGLSTIPTGDLAAGDCADAYFHVRVAKTSAAFDTTRRYRIIASAPGVGSVSTPSPRELYVERLVSQNRNAVLSLTTPAIDRPATSSAPAHATFVVGRTYTFTVNAKTATGGYEQLETFTTFPSPVFRVVGVNATYAQPAGAANDRVYADACGWDNVIGPRRPTGTYLSCAGPANYTGGKAGGNPIAMTYTVVATATGSGTLQSLIYDFSGSSFHYNSDYMSATAGMEYDVVAAPDLAVGLSHGSFSAGGAGSYDVTVTNVGGYPASGPIALTTTLADGLTYTGGSGTGWTCSADGQVVTCTHAGPLAPSDVAGVTIGVAIDEDPPESMVTTASVSSPDDTNTENDSDTDEPTIDRPPAPTTTTTVAAPTTTTTAAPATTTTTQAPATTTTTAPATTTTTVAPTTTTSTPLLPLPTTTTTTAPPTTTTVVPSTTPTTAPPVTTTTGAPVTPTTSTPPPPSPSTTNTTAPAAALAAAELRQPNQVVQLPLQSEGRPGGAASSAQGQGPSGHSQRVPGLPVTGGQALALAAAALSLLSGGRLLRIWSRQRH